MRIVKFAVPALALVAWWTVSVAQPPPAEAPAPAEEPRPATPQPPAEEDEPEAPADDSAEDPVDDVFIPTEELQPDAAVTFPVDI